MHKNDFKVGQTVYLKTRNFGMCWECEEIEEATIKTIGRKYITVAVSPWREYQFDMEENFREKTDTSPTYDLICIFHGKIFMIIGKRNISFGRFVGS